MSASSMRIDADTLAQRAGGSWAGPAVANHVTSIEIDSRRCSEGSLFVALPGAQADGHDCSGAVAMLAAPASTIILVCRSRSPRCRKHQSTPSRKSA